MLSFTVAIADLVCYIKSNDVALFIGSTSGKVHMKDKSRRKFVKSCTAFAFSGLASPFLITLAGCQQSTGTGFRAVDQGNGRPAGVRTVSAAQIDPNFEPPYLKLHKSGELKKRGEELWQIMESCRLCHRECGVNRLEGEKGFCRASSRLDIFSYHAHFGEERPLVGSHGSGTIFFSHCGLRCVFCINWEINHDGQGSPRSIDDLADMMLHLQEQGCGNVNVVTPTHYPAHILLALDRAAGRGLRLPLLYNTCGWERLDVLKKLDGVVDIYLPDFKYADGEMAAKYSAGADTYPEYTKDSLLEMHRQVGVARPADDGLMYRGLMIRHLVMPNRVGGSREIMAWIGKNLPGDTYVNIMSQYRPMHRAAAYPDIDRRITRDEYEEAVRAAKEAGLTNLDIQGAPLS
jgi:putative pyruvate formate lyase activating enzyme